MLVSNMEVNAGLVMTLVCTERDPTVSAKWHAGKILRASAVPDGDRTSTGCHQPKEKNLVKLTSNINSFSVKSIKRNNSTILLIIRWAFPT